MNNTLINKERERERGYQLHREVTNQDLEKRRRSSSALWLGTHLELFSEMQIEEGNPLRDALNLIAPSFLPFVETGYYFSVLPF